METIKAFIREHPHMWWALYVPVYLVMFFGVEHAVTDNYWATQLPVDEKIPFLEGFILFYIAWLPFQVGTGLYLIVKDAEGFRLYMWSLMLSFTVSTLVCLLLPNGQDLRPAVLEHRNLCTAMVERLYAIDTNTNVFPSVHVVGVMMVLFAVWRTPGLRRGLWRAGAAVLGALIVASTLFIKQHALIDVVGGVILSVLTYAVIYGVVARRRERRRKEADTA
jgi:membrane-associated phospholipid phosphatase